MNKVIRYIVLLIATVLLAGTIFIYLNNSISWNWVMDILICWFIITWVASLYLVWQFHLPKAYYSILKFEKDGRIYRAFGIKYFQKIVKDTPVRILAPGYRKNTDRESLLKLEKETQKAESIHVLAFFLTSIVQVYAIYIQEYSSFFWLLLFNSILNVYPVMLQRYNRERIQRIHRRNTLKFIKRNPVNC